jgi:hypothetical protein
MKSDKQVPPYPIGTNVYIRAVTYHSTGRIAGVNGQWLELENAAYIATDGRYGDATERGIQNVDGSEIEPVGGEHTMRVNLNAIVDVVVHPGELPSRQMP